MELMEATKNDEAKATVSPDASGVQRVPEVISNGAAFYNGAGL
jgi:hypothetical protein